MRHEHERRKAVDSRREIFRNMLAGMTEDQVHRLEEKLVCQVGQLNQQIEKNEKEVEHKIELLSDIDDRLLYLEKFNFKNITKLAKSMEIEPPHASE